MSVMTIAVNLKVLCGLVQRFKMLFRPRVTDYDDKTRCQR